MPQLDAATYLPQVFWLAVAFAVLYWIVSRVALPRVAEVLQARQGRIEADLERAEHMRKEAEATLEAYEQAMADARARAHRLNLEAGQRIAADAQRRNDELSATIAKETAAAEARIGEASERAIAELHQLAKELVGAASERLAGITPTEAAIEAALAAAGGGSR